MRIRALALAAAIGALGPLAAGAQRPTLAVTGDSAGARVQARALLDEGEFVRLLRSGFPLRLHYRLELWRLRSNWWDQFVREAAWDVVARHDPLADDYVVLRSRGGSSRHATTEGLARALEIPFVVALPPPAGRAARFYYIARLEITTLSASDLDELTHWLRGEVGPAVSGRGNVGDALAQGAQRALLRLAGLPRVTLEARTAPFRTGR